MRPRYATKLTRSSLASAVNDPLAKLKVGKGSDGPFVVILHIHLSTGDILLMRGRSTVNSKRNQDHCSFEQ